MTQLPPGAFRPGNSLLHELDSAVKLICFVLLLLAEAACSGPVGHCVMAGLTVAVVYLSQLERKEAFSPVKLLLPFLVCVFLLCLLFTPTASPWYRLWFFAPSPEGLSQALKVTLRILVTVLLCTTLTATTSPMKLAAGLEKLLLPLGRLGLPACRFSRLISTALLFIPIFYEESENIRRAQLARGGRFSGRGYLDRASAMLPLVLPLTVAVFRRAHAMALLMESRGAGVRRDCRRPKWDKPSLQDVCALLVAFAALALQLVVV